MAVYTSFFTRWVNLSPALLVVLILLPVATGLLGVLLPAFGWLPALGENTFNISGFIALWNTPGFGSMALLSYTTSLVSTLVVVLISCFILASYFNSRFLVYIQHVLGPILVIPHAAAAIAIGFLIAPSGFVMRLLSPGLTGAEQPPDILIPNDPYGFSIIVGLALKELPFILLMTLAAMQQKEIKKNIEAHFSLAKSMGYSPLTGFFKAVLPTLYPFMRLPIYAILAYSSASIEIPMILGPNAPPTLAVAIMQWFTDVDLSLRIKASAGAIVQLLVTLLVLFSWWLFEKTVMLITKSSLSNGRRVYADGLWRALTHGITLVIILTIGAALLGLVLWSVAGYWSFPHALPNTLVTDHWHSALTQVPETLSNTLIVGLVSSCLALILTLFALEAEQQRQKPLNAATSLLIYLPLLVPSIAFLFGIVWMKEQIGAGSAFVYVIMGHLLFVLPYVFLSTATSYRKLDLRYAKVAASLGCTPWRIFWSVKLPQLSIPLFFAYALGMAISFSQYLPTLLLGGGRISTITTEAVALSSGASRRVTAVYVIMQLALPAMGFLLAWLIPKIVFRQRQ